MHENRGDMVCCPPLGSHFGDDGNMVRSSMK